MDNIPTYNPLFTKFDKRLAETRFGAFLSGHMVKVSLGVAVLLSVFLLVEITIKHLSVLSRDSYFEPSLIIALGTTIGGLKLAILTGILIAGIRFGSLLSDWQTLQQGQLIRYFIVFLAFLIAWPLSTYGYNFYFDQGYYFDRAALVVLLLLLWWRPLFIYPFLVLVFATLLQLKEPNLGGTILAHKVQVLHVLNLFAAAFFIHTVSGYRKTGTFVFMTCCLVAGSYWVPALAKLQLGWLQHGQLYHMIMAAYAHGWLGFLEPSQIVAFAHSISWLDWPMRIAVIAVEAGCLFFMYRRNVSIALLIGVITFHIGVFVLIGFLFWTWILLDVALLVLLLKDRKMEYWPIYGKQYLMLSIVLIGFSTYWAEPPALGWFDTRLNYTYKLEVVTEHGNRYTLPSEFFAPYEDIFTMTSFSYLVKDHAVLVGPYGVTKDTAKAEKLLQASTAAEIFELEKTQIPVRYNEQRAELFYNFVSRFVANRNTRSQVITDLRWLSPPRQFWSFSPDQKTVAQDPVIQVIVNEFTTLYDGSTLEVIRQHEVMKLNISDKST